MHQDYKENGKNDFVCTNFHHFFIRNNSLVSVVNLRSNDAIFGFFNDFYWYSHVHNNVKSKLQTYFTKKLSNNDQLIYTANSFHVYERHFNMLMNFKF